jgi:hypothetical protein
MAKKKKNRPLSPRHHRMRRPARLHSARQWLASYSGTNVVRGYRKRYGVDWLCAVRELRQLGVEINPQYVAQLEVTMEQRRLERQRRKQQREGNGIEEHAIDSDDTFAYIAGYTSGGAPYGLTWEQWDGLEDDWEQLEDADSDEAS